MVTLPPVPKRATPQQTGGEPPVVDSNCRFGFSMWFPRGICIWRLGMDYLTACRYCFYVLPALLCGLGTAKVDRACGDVVRLVRLRSSAAVIRAAMWHPARAGRGGLYIRWPQGRTLARSGGNRSRRPGVS
jgi:hypothetical protein